ncbi:hypothetical protein J4429_00765 [Candidatus Pacearchaeota archaeon]|nr:hypothetical protein [Candidatus Pacearchaeota archaeon]
MEKEFGKIKKNAITDIIIRIDDFGGKTGLTIREFATSDKYTGFTKSGTRISAEAFKDFKAIINSINEKDFGEIKPEIKAPEPPEESELNEEQNLEVEEEHPRKLRKKKIQEELL